MTESITNLVRFSFVGALIPSKVHLALLALTWLTVPLAGAEVTYLHGNLPFARTDVGTATKAGARSYGGEFRGGPSAPGVWLKPTLCASPGRRLNLVYEDPVEQIEVQYRSSRGLWVRDRSGPTIASGSTWTTIPLDLRGCQPVFVKLTSPRAVNANFYVATAVDLNFRRDRRAAFDGLYFAVLTSAAWVALGVYLLTRSRASLCLALYVAFAHRSLGSCDVGCLITAIAGLACGFRARVVWPATAALVTGYVVKALALRGLVVETQARESFGLNFAIHHAAAIGTLVVAVGITSALVRAHRGVFAIGPLRSVPGTRSSVQTKFDTTAADSP